MAKKSTRTTSDDLFNTKNRVFVFGRYCGRSIVANNGRKSGDVEARLSRVAQNERVSALWLRMDHHRAAAGKRQNRSEKEDGQESGYSTGTHMRLFKKNSPNFS